LKDKKVGFRLLKGKKLIAKGVLRPQEDLNYNNWL